MAAKFRLSYISVSYTHLLQMQWNTIHPPVKQIYSLTDRFGYLRLYTRKEVLNEICLPSFIGRRQRHKVFLAKTAMEFTPANENEEAGIALVQDLSLIHI